MSLIPSALINDQDPYNYLKEVLTRPPTHRSREIQELLPHGLVYLQPPMLTLEQPEAGETWQRRQCHPH